MPVQGGDVQLSTLHHAIVEIFKFGVENIVKHLLDVQEALWSRIVAQSNAV